MDKITLADLEVFYRVGVPEEERRRPQRLLITVDMFQDFTRAMTTDDLIYTTDYFAVSQRIKMLGEGREWKLIESLAGEIVEMIRKEFGVPRVRVEVKKFIIPETRHVSVCVERG